MGCCVISKFILIIVNTFVALCGLALMGAGIYAVVDPNAIDALHWNDLIHDVNSQSNLNITDSNEVLFQAAAITAIAIGALVFLVSFIGCCGAWMENKCVLGIYMTLMICLLIIEIVVGICALVVCLSTDLKNQFPTILSELSPTDLQKVQDEFDCCGTGFNATSKPPAGTTCKTEQMKTGCATAMYDTAKSVGIVLACIAFGAALIEAIALFLSCCMCLRGDE